MFYEPLTENIVLSKVSIVSPRNMTISINSLFICILNWIKVGEKT